MSELIEKADHHETVHWRLLTSVSAAALILSTYWAGAAQAADNDADHPLVWIELGGQLQSIGGQGAAFAPPFLSAYPTSSVLWKGTSPIQAQQPPLAFEEDGTISIQPKNSDWVFSAAIRYGRSSTSRRVDHQTNGVYYREYKYGKTIPSHNTPGTAEEFAKTQNRRTEDHLILDFLAGKDVGLGLFGKDASSTVSAGVRIVKFESVSNIDIVARPVIHFDYIHGPSGFALNLPYFYDYYFTGRASRKFHGVGPTLSWKGSAPFIGNPQEGEFAIDWDINAAVLFGKQRTYVEHHQSAHYWHTGKYDTTLYNSPTATRTSDESIVVPNLGGSAGVSFRYANAKMSLGYRADLFMNAMDTGIDARKSSNLLLHGPYAKISVGLGG